MPKICDVPWKPGGRVLPTVGFTGGRLCPKGTPFLARSLLKGRENCYFTILKGHKIGCKVEEMVAKVKFIKQCKSLAEMTTCN